jgi:hypothetical protein
MQPTIMCILIRTASALAVLAAASTWPPIASPYGEVRSGYAAPIAQNDNDEEEVPEEALDDLTLLLSWAGGGASGTIGHGCDAGPTTEYTVPCEIAQNELLRVNRLGTLDTRAWTYTTPTTFTLRLPDGRERLPFDDGGDSLFWWIPIDAEPGIGALLLRQGMATAQVPVRILARGASPLTAAVWDRDGPSVTTELAPAGRASNRLTVYMAGFPANQEVTLLLFRLIESHALGPFAAFDWPLASVSTDARGKATFVWETDNDQQPGSFAIHTVPQSQTNWMFSDQGVQLCIVPRNGPDLCAHPAQAVGPRELVEPLVAESVTHAAQIFARLGRNPGQSLAELECAFAGAALTDRRQQLQSLRTRGDVMDARLRRKVEVQSITDANPNEFRPGLLVTVVERWRGEIRHADGSDDDLEPRRQTWRYVLQRSDGTAVGPTGDPCEKGLVISEATLLP